ncbi:MAG TPA: hypothetical protein VHA52_00745 [Candidatus Babeliaceae bacterium]|nr:hypothetical protein [Candidatus Babeliaceae bacterium]
MKQIILNLLKLSAWMLGIFMINLSASRVYEQSTAKGFTANDLLDLSERDLDIWLAVNNDILKQLKSGIESLKSAEEENFSNPLTLKLVQGALTTGSKALETLYNSIRQYFVQSKGLLSKAYAAAIRSIGFHETDFNDEEIEINSLIKHTLDLVSQAKQELSLEIKDQQYSNTALVTKNLEEAIKLTQDLKSKLERYIQDNSTWLHYLL